MDSEEACRFRADLAGYDGQSRVAILGERRWGEIVTIEPVQ
jgi:hypothetical protein